MRTFARIAARVFAVLLASAAGLGIGVAIVIRFDAGSARADTPADLPPELIAAEQSYRSAGPDAALPSFQALAAEYRAGGDVASEATAVRFIGEILWRQGDFDEAEAQLGRALELTGEAGDDAQRARVLNVLGLLHWDLGNYEAALASFGQAGELAARLGDARLEGALLNNASLVHDERGEYRISLERYHEALDRYEEVDFPRGRGDTLGNIGGVHLLLGHYAEALEYYRQALKISEELESVTAMSQDHGNIALCHLGLGDSAAALQHFDRAIELAAQAGSAQDVAYWTRGKANALLRQGFYQQGLELHRDAVSKYQDVGARTEAVESLHDLGRLYLSLGDSAVAQEWFDRSLALAREIGLARGVTLNLLALGDLQARRQAPEEAAALYSQGWQRAQEAEERALAASALLSLAGVHTGQARFAEAAGEAAQALEIARDLDAPYLQAEASFQLGEMSRLQGDLQRALEQYGEASAALPSIADPDLAWRIHYGRGMVLAAREELPQAVAELKHAVTYIEGVRDRLEEQRFRAGYLQDKYQVYIELARLQMRTGSNADAFSTAERLRARSYFDLISARGPAPLAGAEQRRAVELQARIRQLRRALNEESSLPRPAQRQPAISVYTAELLAAERDYEALLERAVVADLSAGAQAPGFEEVRLRLESGEGLVEYLVSDQELLIFMLTSENLLALSSPLGQTGLNSKVELLRDLLRRPDSERWQRPAASLAAALVWPLREAGALEGLSHLYLVPHGSLNYLPFAMLPVDASGDRLLMEEFTLNYLPTAAALFAERGAGNADESLLAMAPARARLKHAYSEASRVFELFGPESRLAVGEAATESLFKDVAGDFEVLHLATHGYFNKLNPMLSGLELEADESNDGLLELHEIIGLELDADLVTLSACQTALGSGHFSEIPPGDDFVGFTRAFLSAGSGAVMATLWEVDDQSTAELMQQFYSRLRVTAAPGNASALAEAQRRLRASAQYRHPYYWAPFVLMGTNRPPTDPTVGA